MYVQVCTTHAPPRRGAESVGGAEKADKAGERRGETMRCDRGDARHTTRGHTHGQDAGGWRRQGRRSRAGHDTINSGTKADAIRFKKRKQTDRNERITLRCSRTIQNYDQVLQGLIT